MSFICKPLIYNYFIDFYGPWAYGLAMNSHTHHAHTGEEKHFTAAEMVRDVVIGMADGLTVPFALAAGISGAVDSTNLIVTAGLAEIAAGAIAMGLGGYLAARTDAEHYENEKKREFWEIEHKNDWEIAETRQIFEEFGLKGENLDNVVAEISKDKEKWVDFMMRFELNLEKPDAKRAPISAATIGGSYILGGFVPLVSYIMTDDINRALISSAILTLITLGIFGAVKAKLTGLPVLKGAMQTMLVGGLAASVAYFVAKSFGG